MGSGDVVVCVLGLKLLLCIGNDAVICILGMLLLFVYLECCCNLCSGDAVYCVL